MAWGSKVELVPPLPTRLELLSVLCSQLSANPHSSLLRLPCSLPPSLRHSILAGDASPLLVLRSHDTGVVHTLAATMLQVCVDMAAQVRRASLPAAAAAPMADAIDGVLRSAACSLHVANFVLWEEAQHALEDVAARSALLLACAQVYGSLLRCMMDGSMAGSVHPTSPSVSTAVGLRAVLLLPFHVVRRHAHLSTSQQSRVPSSGGAASCSTSQASPVASRVVRRAWFQQWRPALRHAAGSNSMYVVLPWHTHTRCSRRHSQADNEMDQGTCASV